MPVEKFGTILSSALVLCFLCEAEQRNCLCYLAEFTGFGVCWTFVILHCFIDRNRRQVNSDKTERLCVSAWSSPGHTDMFDSIQISFRIQKGPCLKEKQNNFKRKSEHIEFKSSSLVVSLSLVLKGWMSIRHCHLSPDLSGWNITYTQTMIFQNNLVHTQPHRHYNF